MNLNKIDNNNLVQHMDFCGSVKPQLLNVFSNKVSKQTDKAN